MITSRLAFDTLKKDITGNFGRQTFILVTSEVIALVAGVLTNTINTRVLGTEGYGILSLFLTITAFTMIFFRFGIFSSCKLLIASAKDRLEERELIGASLIATAFIGFLYSLFMFTMSFFIDDILNTDIGWILRASSVILSIIPFSILIPEIGIAMNRIQVLSFFNVFPKVAYIIIALLIIRLIEPQPFHLILLNLMTMLLGLIIVIYSFKPSFESMKITLKKIELKTKEYGSHLYVGQITTQSTYQMDKIFITYFVNTTQLGFYSLGLTITGPMTVFSQSLSTIFFKNFVKSDTIPKKVIIYNLIWLLLSACGLLIVGKSIIIFLFGNDFLPTYNLILPLAVAGIFQGMYKPYISFLTAKGLAKEMKRAGIVSSVVFLGTNLLFIPSWGAYGAAIATAISTAFSLAINRYIYHQYLNSKIS